MSTNVETPKKSRKKFILIGLAVLAGLCVLCVAGSLIIGNSPSFKATQSASTAVAAAAVPAQADTQAPDLPAEPTKTKAPTNTPEPTKTPAPTNTPAPTDTMAPTATSTLPPQPVEYSGKGDQIVDVELPFDFGVAHLVYTGGGNFIVTNYDQNNEVIDLLVNEIGAYDGFRPIDFFEGEKTARLEVQSSGPWTITIYPLAKDYMHVCQVPGPCTGKGDDVIILDGGKPDIAKIKYTGERNFIVTAHGGTFPDGLVNEIGAYEGTVMVPSDAFILEILSSGEWEIEITAK